MTTENTYTNESSNSRIILEDTTGEGIEEIKPATGTVLSANNTDPIEMVIPSENTESIGNNESTKTSKPSFRMAVLTAEPAEDSVSSIYKPHRSDDYIECIAYYQSFL